jgi:hypothetical protein
MRCIIYVKQSDIVFFGLLLLVLLPALCIIVACFCEYLVGCGACE